MQHRVEQYDNNGGPSTGYYNIVNSKLQKKYVFVELTQSQAPHGINLILLNKLYKQIKRAKPDLIHIRGLQSEGFYGVLAAILSGYRNIVLSVHGSYADVIKLDFLRKSIYRYIIEPFTLKHASIVYCVCQHALTSKLILKNASKLHGVIPNSAPDFDLSEKLVIRKKVRDNLGILENEILVTTVSRVTYDKGFEDILIALENLMKIKNLKYLVLGDGPYLTKIGKKFNKEIISRRIILTGKSNEVKKHLFASDIFLFPSLHENLSNALLEASAAELPIIATNIGGNPEIIIHNVTGILIKPNSPESIVSSITELIKNKYLMNNLATNALFYVRKKYNRSLILDEISKLYELCLYDNYNNSTI